MTTETKKTVFFDRHVGLGAEIIDFGGWQMPLQYKAGIVQEHLITRKTAGLFDVSHMGRFRIGGRDALSFTENAYQQCRRSADRALSVHAYSQ